MQNVMQRPLLEFTDEHDTLALWDAPRELAAFGTDGYTYNLNADHAAGRIAAATRAAKLILLTDVRGVYRDLRDESSYLPELTAAQAQDLIDSGAAERGMIPKLQSCLDALVNGVERAHIIDGRVPHAVLMEILTDSGIGTMFVKDQ